MNPVITKLAATAAAGTAAVAARKAVELGWREFRGEEPPTMRDEDGDRQLRDLMLWTVAMAGAVWLAKRLATSATVKVLGD